MKWTHQRSNQCEMQWSTCWRDIVKYGPCSLWKPFLWKKNGKSSHTWVYSPWFSKPCMHKNHRTWEVEQTSSYVLRTSPHLVFNSTRKDWETTQSEGYRNLRIYKMCKEMLNLVTRSFMQLGNSWNEFLTPQSTSQKTTQNKMFLQ